MAVDIQTNEFDVPAFTSIVVGKMKYQDETSSIIAVDVVRRLTELGYKAQLMWKGSYIYFRTTASLQVFESVQQRAIAEVEQYEYYKTFKTTKRNSTKGGWGFW